MDTIRAGAWILPALFAMAAGLFDWRTHRIPNWLTVPGLLLGIAVNSILWGWSGTKTSLLGAGLGLLLLFPFVWLRSLGAGDWKLVGAVGAFIGPQALISVLCAAVLLAGLMAVVLVIWKKRVGQTLRNLGVMLGALSHMHLPGPELSLDNPESLKVPFGVAVTIAVLLYLCTVRQGWRVA
jgi:prepilin peptidase CpaA